MKRVVLLIGMNLLFFSVFAQNIGFGTTAPQAKLDLNGDVIFKSVPLSVANGTTNALDVNTNKFASYRLTGPTANYYISGITAGAGDRIITLFNRSGFAMLLVNDDITVPATGNRILTGTGAALTIYSGGNAVLKYESTVQRWEVIGSHFNNLDYFGGNGGAYWSALANDISNTNSGNVGIGINAPIAKLHIAEGANVLFGADTTGPALGFQNVQRKVFWSAAKGSLHVGGLSGFGGRGNWWSDSLTGNFAFSAGSSNLTSGDYSNALGVVNRATGTGSIAIGNNNISSGNYSIALGSSATALGQYSVAIGLGTTVTRDNEIKIGAIDMPGNGKTGLNTLNPKSILEIGSPIDSSALSFSTSGTRFEATMRRSTYNDVPNDTVLSFSGSFPNTSISIAQAYFKNGKMGLGTGNPQSAIHLKGNLQQLRIEGNENAIDLYNDVDYSGSITPNTKYVSSLVQSGLVLQSAAAYPMIFYTSGNQERMRITSGGQIGIGTTNPGIYKLDVNGAVRGSSAVVTNTLGIGTTTASSPLGFANVFGKKVSFYNVDANNDYGIGIQANEMQFYSPPATSMAFGTGTLGSFTPRMTYWPSSGQLGINCTPQSDYMLSVNGKIRAKEIRVNTNWSDYVFADDYQLRSLKDVEIYIKEHRHLPGITDAATLESEGMDVSKMQAAMMAKIEELTLYLIEANKKIEQLQRVNAVILKKLNQ